MAEGNAAVDARFAQLGGQACTRTSSVSEPCSGPASNTLTRRLAAEIIRPAASKAPIATRSCRPWMWKGREPEVISALASAAVQYRPTAAAC
jgi:hypothetical protein